MFVVALFVFSSLILGINGGGITLQPQDFYNGLLSQAYDLVLDVRTLAEWETGHIENATLVESLQLQTSIPPLLLGCQGACRSIVVYCRSGNRAGVAIDLLMNQGFTGTLYNGLGVSQWTDAGLPLVNTTSNTDIPCSSLSGVDTCPATSAPTTSVAPSISPSLSTSPTASSSPTISPSTSPSGAASPSVSPSVSYSPSIATASPSAMPTTQPSVLPSLEPSSSPSRADALNPSQAPSTVPSRPSLGGVGVGATEEPSLFSDVDRLSSGSSLLVAVVTVAMFALI